ncbi:hypothetical protein [Streptomyces sp. R33]|uniref:Uncharacterized protein n=1 Tax=Streptomyces sp. R33 TaxID=3238629 RepID=A0AB39YID2_9ACTN
MAEDAAPVDGAVCVDLRDEIRADQHDIQDVTAPHVVEVNRTPFHRCPGPVGADARPPVGLLRAQRDGPADRAQAAGRVVAAEDQELRAGEGDGADDGFGGVAAADLGPAAYGGL